MVGLRGPGKKQPIWGIFLTHGQTGGRGGCPVRHSRALHPLHLPPPGLVKFNRMGAPERRTATGMVLVAGTPNVGKSSLVAMLTKELTAKRRKKVRRALSRLGGGGRPRLPPPELFGNPRNPMGGGWWVVRESTPPHQAPPGRIALPAPTERPPGVGWRRQSGRLHSTPCTFGTQTGCCGAKYSADTGYLAPQKPEFGAVG